MTSQSNISQPPTVFNQSSGSNRTATEASAVPAAEAGATPPPNFRPPTLPTPEHSLPWFIMVSDSSESLNRLPPPISIADSGDIGEHEFDEFEWDEESAQVTSI